MVPKICYPAIASAILAAGATAQDMPLSQVLVDGEGWELVADGLKFGDACAADKDGNFYFSDVAGGTAIKKVTPRGKVTDYIEGISGISGMQFGPDGTLYACQYREGRVVALRPGAEPVVLCAGVKPNDLVVTNDGWIYFTETPTGRVYRVRSEKPDGATQVAEGITKPNGIALSPDGGTLLVSDHQEDKVWFFRIRDDGELDCREAYGHLRLRNEEAQSRGDGSDVDGVGRYYVTSDLGVQMFDPTGRRSGVILAPNTTRPLVSIAFAGEGLSYMYVANGAAVYRRKTKTKGTGR